MINNEAEVELNNKPYNNYFMLITSNIPVE